MHSDQDHQLVRQTLAGDLSAFDELVRKYQRSLYALCLSFVACREDAQDMAQEVFLKAFTGLKHFRYQSSFRTWIYRIAVNACLNFKSQSKKSVEWLPTFHNGVCAFIDIVEQAEDRRLVQTLVAQLPKKQRTAMVLRLEQGLSYEEISEITGQTVSTVKTTVFYGLEKIKKLVQESSATRVPRFKHVKSG